jgi:hypothetical protein
MGVLKPWATLFIGGNIMKGQDLTPFITGNRLVELMREYDKDEPGISSSKVNLVRVGVFLAYVTGVYDAMSFAFSTPDGVTVGQICAIVSKYLKNHPERWPESADLLVVEALRESFPLKKLSNNKELQII